MLIESEKLLDKKLKAAVERQGGLSIKLVTLHFTGLPDRLCLLPNGRLFFAEIKTTGKKPKKVQTVVHNRLKSLGFRVEVIDNSEQIHQIINDYV